MKRSMRSSMCTDLYGMFLFLHRYQVAPSLAACALRVCSSSGDGDQRSYQHTFTPPWRHALAGLLAGTGAALAYGLHHLQVRKRQDLQKQSLLLFVVSLTVPDIVAPLIFKTNGIFLMGM